MITRSSHVTLKDVADRAYVSIATASLSLRDKPGVSATTRRRVKAVAAELGYHASAAGVLLRNGHPPVIGILLDRQALNSPSGDNLRATLSALVVDLGERGCLVSPVSPGGPTPPVDVLIVLGGGRVSRVPPDIGFGTPVVAVGQVEPYLDIVTVIKCARRAAAATAADARRCGERLAAAALEVLRPRVVAQLPAASAGCATASLRRDPTSAVPVG